MLSDRRKLLLSNLYGRVSDHGKIRIKFITAGRDWHSTNPPPPAWSALGRRYMPRATKLSVSSSCLWECSPDREIRSTASHEHARSMLIWESWIKIGGDQMRVGKGTTEPGYTNKNNQTVLRKTESLGNDHNQRVYVLQCGECGEEYGANGSDVWLRRCPSCQSGAKGLPY